MNSSAQAGLSLVHPDAERPFVSVVAPVFNEVENLPGLYDRLRGVFDGEDVDWELVLVDDGSTDGSPEALRHLHDRDPRVKGLVFSRNFGQDAALTAGLQTARGDAVVLMDADLQDPPELIPEMLAHWRAGNEIVAAQRTRRPGEQWFKRFAAFLWYRLMDRLVPGGFPKDTGDFRLLDRAVVEAFRQYRQYNRLVRSLIASTGFRTSSVTFERPARQAGQTKYGFWKSFGLAATGITGASVAPLRLAFWLGIATMTVALLFSAHFIRSGLTGRTVPGWASIVVSIWLLGGIQCVLLGIIGEYVGRTYIESQRRPIYIVQQTIGVDAPAKGFVEDTGKATDR